jgi:hypothetical protein
MFFVSFLSYKFWNFQILMYQLCTVMRHNFQLKEDEVIVVENKPVLKTKVFTFVWSVHIRMLSIFKSV